MLVKRMDMGWITVKDIKKAKQFFEQTLGLQISSSAEEWGWLEMNAKEGGMTLGIAQEQKEYESQTAGTNAIITFTVEDIIQAKKELESKGVTFHGEIMEVPGHVKLATFQDNDGNRFQLVQVLSA